MPALPAHSAARALCSRTPPLATQHWPARAQPFLSHWHAAPTPPRVAKTPAPSTAVQSTPQCQIARKAANLPLRDDLPPRTVVAPWSLYRVEGMLPGRGQAEEDMYPCCGPKPAQPLPLHSLSGRAQVASM